MDLRQLGNFMALCEEMNFTRTAEKLRIGQPTLSYQMKALEDELGVRLFDRLGKKIAITEAGEILLEHCTNVFANLKSANEQIEELQKVKRGKLVIGALSGDLSHIASMVLIEFHAKYPHIQIQIISLDDVVEKINEIDLALTLMPRTDESLTNIPLYKDEFFLAVREDHVWSERDDIEFSEIKNIPLILNPKSHCFRQSLDDECISAGIVIQPIIESTDSRSILNLVKGGIGASIMSCTLFPLENEGVLKAIKIKNPTIIREVTIVHHKQKYIGTAARGFIEILIKYMKENRSLVE
ncbi:LysR family transcriptional regulator (plasmid) [Bacillus sp. CMF21]|uniref:LysR family transcriptional regulator n=1 Tax=Metabacillus dongyingensis TaxID=2874282 RepID=UPI001FB443F3|nr:LysR family transcriptional regulator [Metabacillus dongyingensis]UNJ81403.1 Transcriptional regulator, LysR family [Metabacillus dongyingensis]USK31436.1 LysR family transcriptional regulator [Bacillus sp. CMF21]